MISAGDLLALPDEAEFDFGPLPDAGFNPMDWVVPTSSRKQVDEAGRFVAAHINDEHVDVEAANAAMDIFHNWRAAHSYPLQAVRGTLYNRAKTVDPKATVVQRLKRLSSIVIKLQRDQHKHMKLSQMQDIGGCRAIVASIGQVEEIVRRYRAGIGAAHELAKEHDYIAAPKRDGYRGHHLICKYRSDLPNLVPLSEYNLRIEVQIRTRLQHAWATALEVVDTFTGNPIKAGQGDPRWRRFFALMGTVIAEIEQRPSVPETPMNRAVLLAELGSLYHDLDVYTMLEGTSAASPEPFKQRTRGAYYYMLFLDPDKRQTSVTGYKEKDLLAATEAVEKQEKSDLSKKSRSQVVLVSATSVRELLLGFPNYQLDTREFLNIVRATLGIIRPTADSASSVSP